MIIKTKNIKGCTDMSLVVVGGNERMKRDYIQLAKNRGYKAKVVLNMSSRVKRSIGSPDAIVIFTSTVSHKLMASVETQAKKQDIPIIRNKYNSKFAFEQSLDLVDECTGACRVCKNKECIMKHQ